MLKNAQSQNYLKILWKLLENAGVSFFLLYVVVQGTRVFMGTRQEHFLPIKNNFKSHAFLSS